MPDWKQALIVIMFIFFAFLGPDALRAEDIVFSVPVDCPVGQKCFIQNYYDHDQGPGRKDYACGRLSYDGHDGTDFRLPDYRAMQEGTAILAAAPGKVLRVRDGMPDINLNSIDPELIEGREAGNGVLLDHGRGWVTQYSHLRQGSVLVEPGQQVKRGQKLGLIGLSGMTEFPHVEFTVRYQGKELDPFVGKKGFHGCGTTTGSLWEKTALKEMKYQPTGVLNAGFANYRPVAARARRGMYADRTWTVPANALVFWVDLFGVLEHDRQEFLIIGPAENQLVHETSVLQESKVSWFAYAGLRRPAQGWTPGVYSGIFRLHRAGKVQVEVSKTMEMQ